MDLEKLKIDLDEYGFVLIRELIPRREAELAAKRVVEITSEHSDGSTPDQHLRSFLDYLDPSDYPLFAKLLAHPVCMELARHLVGEGFQLAEPGCRWRRPGASAGPVHITVPIERFAQSGLPTPNVCFVVPFAWMLNDLTAEMGATFYLPFSQCAPGVPRQGMNYKHAVAAEGPAGSVLIHHGGLWHGFGPNTTKDQSRVGLMAGYFAPWMDPVATGYRLLKRSVRDRMPEAIQKLNQRAAEG